MREFVSNKHKIVALIHIATRSSYFRSAVFFLSIPAMHTFHKHTQNPNFVSAVQYAVEIGTQNEDKGEEEENVIIEPITFYNNI